MKYYKGIPITLFYVMVYTIAPVLISILKLQPQYSIIIQIPVLLMLFTYIIFNKRQHKNMYTSSAMNSLYYIYMILCFIMFLRGYDISERGVNLNLNGKLYLIFGNGLYILWTLIPLVALNTYPYFHLKQFCRFGVYICTICTLITLFNLPSLIISSHIMSIGFEGSASGAYARTTELFAPVLLLLAYLPKKERIIYIICFLINILVLILLARRGALLMYVILIAFSFLLIYKRLSISQKILAFFIISLIALFGVSQIIDSDIFSYLQTRGLEDTRKHVNEALLDQMSSTELLFGKGLNGRYYLPLKSDDFYDGWRYSCETGFLDIVLKGGFVMAIIYIILLVIPSMQGIFNSNNTFCKAGGLYILWSIIYLYPFGVLDFNISFFFIWMWVILCSMPNIRKMTDAEIQELFFYNNTLLPVETKHNY